MKIAIFLPATDAEDMLFEDALALTQIFRAKGYATKLYARTDAHPWLREYALPLEQLPRLSGEDILFYYACAGTEPRIALEQLPCRKILLFYDMVPARYWKGYHEQRHMAAESGMQELCQLSGVVDLCMASSAFNASVLRQLNYQCPITVRYPLMSFSEYTKSPDPAQMEQYGTNGFVNFLCVGEVAPHKKLEDVIRTYYCYQKYCEPKSHLFLVGECHTPRYIQRLKRYAKALELDETQVIFTGTVSFSELLAFYHLASLFLSMSEHEGFCVPLIEAMYFGIPILAYGVAAIPDLLGGSGVALPTNDPMEAAMMADRIMKDPAMRREIAAGQRRRYQEFSYPAVRKTLEEQFETFLEDVPPHIRKRQPLFSRK